METGKLLTTNGLYEFGVFRINTKIALVSALAKDREKTLYWLKDLENIKDF